MRSLPIAREREREGERKGGRERRSERASEGGVWACVLGSIRLSYKPYLFYQPSLFFLIIYQRIVFSAMTFQTSE